jgi:DNA repair exonuclease SbcCD nuclease subunit
MKPWEAIEDVALKILHTADWHLGCRFRSFDEEDQRKLTRARLESVKRVFGVAERNAVDAVLCAGDLFDEPAPPEQWWGGLLDFFKGLRWTNRPVFLLPGNHDPLEAGSVWAADHSFRCGLPSWVHVVDRDDYSMDLSPDAVLYAAPCRSQAGSDDLAMRLPARAAGDRRIRIGLVHGQTFDLDGHQTNFPIDPEAAVKRGLDYLALGDTHSFREFAPKSNPMVYPGAPEATKFGEVDSGSVAVVFFLRQGRPPIIQRESVSKWRWRDECCRSSAELEELRRDDLRDCVLRLTLNMEVTLAEMSRVEAIVRELKGDETAHGKAGVLQVHRQNLSLATADLGGFGEDLPDVLKSVVSRLQEKSSVPGGEAAKLALFQLYRIVGEARR